MTPEEAENFYEEDEDPAEVFAWFDGTDGQIGPNSALFTTPGQDDEAGDPAPGG